MQQQKDNRPLHLANRFNSYHSQPTSHPAEDLSSWGPTSNARIDSPYQLGDHSYSDFGDSRSQSPLDGGSLSQTMTPPQHGFADTPSSSVYDPSPVPSYYNTPEQKLRDIFYDSPTRSNTTPLFGNDTYPSYTPIQDHISNGFNSRGSPIPAANGLPRIPHNEDQKIVFRRGGRPLTLDDVHASNRASSPASSAHHRIRQTPTSFKSPKKSQPNKSKKDPNRKELDEPLSVLTRHMIYPEVRDMEAFVSRPASVRVAEAAARKGNVARPMNSFMLYRSAYAERVKEWGRENNHQVVSTIIGDSWRHETDEVKEWFAELAKRERDQHQRVFPTYKFRPGKERMERNALEAAARKEMLAGGSRVEDLSHAGGKTKVKVTAKGKKPAEEDGYDSDDVLDDLDDEWLPGKKKRKISAHVPTSMVNQRNVQRSVGQSFKTSPVVGMKPLPLNLGFSAHRPGASTFGNTTGSSPYYTQTLSPANADHFRFDSNNMSSPHRFVFEGHTPTFTNFHDSVSKSDRELGLVDPKLISNQPASGMDGYQPATPTTSAALGLPGHGDAALGFGSPMTPRKAGFSFDGLDDGKDIFNPRWHGF